MLLVEDCEMQLSTLGVLATACGYKHVIKATSGEQALDMINCGAVGRRGNGTSGRAERFSRARGGAHARRAHPCVQSAAVRYRDISRYRAPATDASNPQALKRRGAFATLVALTALAAAP